MKAIVWCLIKAGGRSVDYLPVGDIAKFSTGIPTDPFLPSLRLVSSFGLLLWILTSPSPRLVKPESVMFIELRRRKPLTFFLRGLCLFKLDVPSIEY